MKAIIQTTAVIFYLSFLISSCKKEGSAKPPVLSAKEKILTANIWQIDKVSVVSAGISSVIYVRGGLNNSEDFSLVRAGFKAGGIMHYTDINGLSGTDGKWRLMDDETKIELSDPISGILLGEELLITTETLSYKMKDGADYIFIKMIPFI